MLTCVNQLVHWSGELAGRGWLVGELSDLLPWAILLLVLGAGGATAWVAEHRRRKQALGAADRRAMGLPYAESLMIEHFELLAAVPLMQRGRDTLAANVISADTGALSLTLYDYQYTTGSGKNKSTHKQTVVWVADDSLNLPEFRLAPESWMQRLGDLFSKQDIDFDDDPEFSRRFLLAGPDQASIRDFLDPRRRQALLKLQNPHLEVGGNGFLYYRPGRYVAPEQYKTLMADALAIHQAFADG